jgi:hypothetical protein
LPLSLPPRDAQGRVIPHDHAGISDKDGIIRRISIHHVTPDPATGARRISSMAFVPSSGTNGGMSIDLQALIEESGQDARLYVQSPPWVGAVRFDAEMLRAEKLQVGFDPLPENLFHGQVWGAFPKSLRRRLATLAKIFVPIPEQMG